MPQMDGRNPLVTGYYRRRADAILKCALVALRFGYKAFAVQHQGWCATGPRAHVTYRKYGRSNRCRNGKGGPWANDVYAISGRCTSYRLNAIYVKLKLNEARVVVRCFVCKCLFLQLYLFPSCVKAKNALLLFPFGLVYFIIALCVIARYSKKCRRFVKKLRLSKSVFFLHLDLLQLVPRLSLLCLPCR